MLRVNNFVGFGAGGAGDGNVLEYRSHTHTVGSSIDPTVPSGILAGDLLVAFGVKEFSTAVSTPSGWTRVDEDTDADGTIHMVAKIADGTETGDIVLFTSFAADKGMCVAFKGEMSSLGSMVDIAAQVTDGNPAAQVKNASTLGTTPFLVIGVYATQNATVDPRTFTGATADGEEGATEAWCKWKAYLAGSSPSDITIDMDGEGVGNALASAIIEVNF